MTRKEVMSIQTVEELLRLQSMDFVGRMISQEEIQHILEVCDAFWMHSGDPTNPHAELTSGLCSNGYVNCAEALSYTNICQIMADQAICRFLREYHGPIDWVIGSSYAAIDFSKDVANILEVRHGYTEKGEDKEQIWKRWAIGENEVVLQAEELMTTSGTTLAVRRGIEKGNPNPVQFAPVVLVLVHRSDVYEIEGAKIVYLAHFDIQNWEPDECPLCAAGSERLRPKQNWSELTGKTRE